MNRLNPAWLASVQIRTLQKAFATHEKSVRFVGGCVRDTALKRPVRDIDVATSLPPEKVMQLLDTARIKNIPTGLKHGTITAIIDKKQIEITTLRKDMACDGRHAKVEFTDDWQEDAARRDFTMNALYLSFEGELFDYHQGLEDAKAGHVRFIGDARQRITEDYLRILRFFRFYAHYGKAPADAKAVAACKAHKNGLEKLSGERIQAEMLKLLAASDPVPAYALMQKSGICQALHLRGNQKHLAGLLAAEKQSGVKANIGTRLAVLVEANDAKTIARRWKLSNALLAELTMLHENKLPATNAPAKQRKLLRQLGRSMFEQLVLFSWATKGKKDYPAMLKLAATWSVPEFPITGSDLKRMGIKEGKALGAKLRQLEKKWEKSNYTLSKKQLLTQANR